MLCNEVVKLVTIANTTNDAGDLISSPTEREVMANKKSVRQSEFYQAMAIGLKPEVVFELRTVEYDGETLLSHGDKEYRIIRSYARDDEWTELTCTSLVNKAGD